jgi:hypothetical protein
MILFAILSDVSRSSVQQPHNPAIYANRCAPQSELVSRRFGERQGRCHPQQQQGSLTGFPRAAPPQRRCVPMSQPQWRHAWQDVCLDIHSSPAAVTALRLGRASRRRPARSWWWWMCATRPACAPCTGPLPSRESPAGAEHGAPAPRNQFLHSLALSRSGLGPQPARHALGCRSCAEHDHPAMNMTRQLLK